MSWVFPLEILDLIVTTCTTNRPGSKTVASPLDLSKATRGNMRTRWIIMTSQTIRSQTFKVPPSTREEAVHQEWQDLNHILIRLWTSHSIRPQVIYVAGGREESFEGRCFEVLPELTKRGLVGLVDIPSWNSNIRRSLGRAWTFFAGSVTSPVWLDGRRGIE